MRHRARAPGASALSLVSDATCPSRTAGAASCKLGFRPPSLKSDVHKNITLKVRSKSIKSARIKEVATTYDPQRAQQERVRAKDDEIRIKRRKTGRANWGSHEPATAMDSSFLEYEDDASNLGAIKRNIRRGGRGAMHSLARALHVPGEK